MADSKTPKVRSTLPPKQLGVRLPADVRAKLDAIARAERNGVSSVARRLLTAALSTVPAGHEAA